MLRRTFLASGIALAATPVLAEEKLTLDAISRYIMKITRAKCDFAQINDDGTLSTGTLYIWRPGRMRFEYDSPEDLLVMAGGGQVAIFDGKSNISGAERYPLRRTPLNLILERDIDLGSRDMVIGHEFDGTATIVTAQDPERPEYGHLQLKFTDNPAELRQWVVFDGQGARTTVVLGQLELPSELPGSLFSIEFEEAERRGN
ncbi:MAG: outer membrane lipoprotein carrier protein LolA [Boseongicola sp. SB0673_bin_14]|nr:outer membrane lipoprotein carrier protein LolA [Boseongicola sp. SB0673_bin_14]